ncbi:MAG: DUF3800 domain-containing protein [Anaerolineales bacterium]|nr:DUF3800 domain-containing protein [Anaerolineales bacterium]
MSQSQSQSLSLYIDESGQHTAGRLFVVGGVIVPGNLEDIEAVCLAAEDASGKRSKWKDTHPDIRIAYLRQLMRAPELLGNTFYCVFENTRKYELSKQRAIAYAAALYPGARITAHVDALSKTQRQKYARGLRQRGLKVTMRGIRDEYSSPLLRLADTIAGLSFRAHDIPAGELTFLHKQAVDRSWLVRLGE